MIRPPKQLVSNSSQAAWFNRLLRSSDQHRAVPSKGLLATVTTRGTTYSNVRDPAMASSSMMQTFKITAIGDNDLTCVTYDGATSGTTTYQIARPWLSRRYTWDTLTINGVTYAYVDAQKRTATSGTTTEIQRITFAYTVGDMIIAAQVSQVSDYGTWEWLDLNMDGRDWAREAS